MINKWLRLNEWNFSAYFLTIIVLYNWLQKFVSGWKNLSTNYLALTFLWEIVCKMICIGWKFRNEIINEIGSLIGCNQKET